MKFNSDMRRLVKAARAEGWTVEPTKGSHVRFVSPRGMQVIASGSVSDQRGIKNLRADLRRAGLKLKDR